MKEYFKHTITPRGFIELREKDENGELFASLIRPDEPIPEEYEDQLQEDENFSKYRTEENKTSYQKEVEKERLSDEQIKTLKRKRASLEAGDFHVAIDLLSFDGGQVKEVYDEQGNDTGLTPISESINNAISQLPKQKRRKFSILLDKRTLFKRTNKDVIAIAESIGMNEDQIDEFYQKAKTL